MVEISGKFIMYIYHLPTSFTIQVSGTVAFCGLGLSLTQPGPRAKLKHQLAGKNTLNGGE